MGKTKFYIALSQYEVALLREEIQIALSQAMADKEGANLAALIRFKDKLDVFLQRMTEAEYAQKNRIKFTDPIV